MSKSDELRARVGNTELHFCGRQKQQTQHIWIEEDRTEVRFLTHRYQAWLLKCRECGLTDDIYTNKPA
jgi:hypothetical protein